MADSKQLRQFAAQQVPAPTAMRGKRPEDLDDQGQDAEQAATEAQDAPAADSMSSEAPASEPLHTTRVATDAAAGTEGGPSAALIGAGALGAVGLAVAVAGGGGGKSGDFKPPVIGTLDPDVPPPKPERPTPRPTPEEPKPEQPKPGDQKPQEPAPNPEGQTKPDQPTNPVQPTNPGGNPETPTNPSGPSPEEQKPNPETVVPPVKPSAPTVTLVNDTGNYLEKTKSDGITNDATLRVGGISEGASWRYSVNDGQWKDGTDDGIISADALSLQDGTHRVRVQQVSDRGVTSDWAELNFQLDTHAQTPPLYAYSVDRPLRDWSILDFQAVSGIDSPNEAVQFSLDLGSSWIERGLLASQIIGNNGPVRIMARLVDVAGNISDPSEWNLVLETSGPSAFLKSDTGVSSTDGITNISTISVGDLREGASWKYSLDGGATWKAGTATNEIAASEFGFDEGVKSVKVQQFTTDGSHPFSERGESQSAIRTYEFTFQRQTVEANIGEGYTFETKGTVGADRFVVSTARNGFSSLGNYRADQGDMVDLRGLFEIDTGKQISDYIRITTGVGGREVNVSYDGQLATNRDLYLVVGYSYFGDISVMYSGGVLVG
ncbi:hypothetical protein [Roseateles sp. MS654]|uniref:hypothetical protein n=1 Tax=Roseateles sp. MS654 TaxID=3412685 RepID=UPI003C2EE93C